MNRKLSEIKKKAIQARENLTYGKIDDQRYIGKLDKIIRGAVLVKWMHRIACIFFITFAAFFMYMVYPQAKAMMLMLGFATGGYGVSLLGIIIQMKLYERTIGKVQSALQIQTP